MLPDFERVDRIGEFWAFPESRAFAELLIDCEEDRTVRAILIGMSRDRDRRRNRVLPPNSSKSGDPRSGRFPIAIRPVHPADTGATGCGFDIPKEATTTRGRRLLFTAADLRRYTCAPCE